MAMGRMLNLPNGSIVFLGLCPDNPDGFRVGFINTEGHRTKLLLSRAAMEALVGMYHDTALGMPEQQFPEPTELAWKLVSEGMT